MQEEAMKQAVLFSCAAVLLGNCRNLPRIPEKHTTEIQVPDLE
jgi:hypothetical protein